MAYTLLDAVNKILQRLGTIQGSQGNLTDFSGTTNAVVVTIVIQVINEGLQDLAAMGPPIPGLTSGAVGANGTATQAGNITLQNGVREVAVPNAVSGAISYPGELVVKLVNTTLRVPMYDYPGGYEQMLVDQPDPTLFNGVPLRWCINPVNKLIRFDFTPNPQAVGQQLNCLFIPRISLTAPTDPFPVSDTVVDQMIEAWTMLYNRDRKKADYDRESYMRSLSVAMRYAVRIVPRQSYGLSHRQHY